MEVLQYKLNDRIPEADTYLPFICAVTNALLSAFESFALQSRLKKYGQQKYDNNIIYET